MFTLSVAFPAKTNNHLPNLAAFNSCQVLRLVLFLACMTTLMLPSAAAVLDTRPQQASPQLPQQQQEEQEQDPVQEQIHSRAASNLHHWIDHSNGNGNSLHGLAASPAPDYSRPGPFTPLLLFSTSLDVPLDNATCSLRLHLTCPQASSHGTQASSLATVPLRNIPLLLLLSGFQMPASYYTSLAQHIASWGYVVLQYDLPGILLKKVVRDDKEVAWLPKLLSWVRSQAGDSASPLHGLVDVEQLAVMGHSRGAKLAALMLAGDPGVGAAVLIDPVDMTDVTRKMGYPSAIAALAGRGASAAILGAGICGRCNPVAEGYRGFWQQLAAGSWQVVVPQAGHMQFTDAAGPAGWALDVLCGSGRLSHKDVISLAAATSVAWLQRCLRPGDDTQAGLEAFKQWADARQAQGIISFDVKQAEHSSQEPILELVN